MLVIAITMTFFFIVCGVTVAFVVTCTVLCYDLSCCCCCGCVDISFTVILSCFHFSVIIVFLFVFVITHCLLTHHEDLLMFAITNSLDKSMVSSIIIRLLILVLLFISS